MRRTLIILVVLGSLLGLVLVVLFIALHNKSPKTFAPIENNQRQLINALPIADRPFVALFPHSSGKLITLYVENKNNSKNISVEIEYLSGNALKGGRSSIDNSVVFPYAQAFLLGSCSAGGKCSFDKDITTGSIKTKLDQAGVSQVLKSNYTFITANSSATTDQKLIFNPAASLKQQLILGGSHGFPGSIAQEAAYEPVVLTSDRTDPVRGKLKIIAPYATRVVFFDGVSYVDAKGVKVDGGWSVDVNQKPRAINTTITRDDLKGATEDITFYLVGPYIAVK